MKKRIIAIAIIAVMAFGVFAFSGCDLNSDLSEDKASAVTAIENHAETKISENSYTYQGLEAIAQAVESGKVAVDTAETKTAIDDAVRTAKGEINEVPKKSANSIKFERGVFNSIFGENSSERPTSKIVQNKEELLALFYGYSVQWEDDVAIWEQYDEYFESGALVFHFFGVSGTHAPEFTLGDVQVVDSELKLFLIQHGSTDGRAYFDIIIVIEVSKSDIANVTNIQADIKIVAEDDIEMDEQLKSQIIQTAWNTLFAAEHSSATINDVYIEQYFGIFNESVAVLVWLKDHSWFREVVDVNIAEFEFSFNIGREIKVWRNGEFYDLRKAVDEGLLTIENIKTIHDLWSKN